MKKSLLIFYDFYANQKKLMNDEVFLQFYKDFEIFPDFITKNQLFEIFDFLNYGQIYYFFVKFIYEIIRFLFFKYKCPNQRTKFC